MNGETALKYARSRHSPTDGGDFNRAKRQQQIIEAVKDKVINIGFLPKVIPLMDEFKKDLKTDMGIEEAKKAIGFAGMAREYTISSFVFTTDNFLAESFSANKQYILVPKEGIDQWQGIQKAAKNIIQGILPTQTPTATPSGKLK